MKALHFTINLLASVVFLVAALCMPYFFELITSYARDMLASTDNGAIRALVNALTLITLFAIGIGIAYGFAFFVHKLIKIKDPSLENTPS